MIDPVGKCFRMKNHGNILLCVRKLTNYEYNSYYHTGFDCETTLETLKFHAFLFYDNVSNTRQIISKDNLKEFIDFFEMEEIIVDE